MPPTTRTAALWASLVVLAPLAARAEPSAKATEEARQHFQKGQAAFDAENFAEAMTEFEAGYAVLPRPGFLLNMAQTARKMGDLRKARSLYKKFLLAAPDSKQGPQVIEIIAEIDSALKDEEQSDGKKPATAAVPPRPSASPKAAPTPSPAPSTGAAPEGGETVATAEAGPALIPKPKDDDEAPPGLGVARKPAPPPPGESDSGPVYTKWWFWTVVGAVVIGGGVGVWAATRSSSTTSDFHERGTWGALRR